MKGAKDWLVDKPSDSDVFVLVCSYDKWTFSSISFSCIPLCAEIPVVSCIWTHCVLFFCCISLFVRTGLYLVAESILREALLEDLPVHTGGRHYDSLSFPYCSHPCPIPVLRGKVLYHTQGVRTRGPLSACWMHPFIFFPGQIGKPCCGIYSN